MRSLRLLWCYSFWCAIIYALRLYCCCCCCCCVCFKPKIEDSLRWFLCCFPFAHITTERPMCIYVLYPFSSHTEQYRFRTYIRCVLFVMLFVPVYFTMTVKCMYALQQKKNPNSSIHKCIKHVFIVKCVFYFCCFSFIFLLLTGCVWVWCFFSRSDFFACVTCRTQIRQSGSKR